MKWCRSSGSAQSENAKELLNRKRICLTAGQPISKKIISVSLLPAFSSRKRGIVGRGELYQTDTHEGLPAHLVGLSLTVIHAVADELVKFWKILPLRDLLIDVINRHRSN